MGSYHRTQYTGLIIHQQQTQEKKKLIMSQKKRLTACLTCDIVEVINYRRTQCVIF
jgi:hypothetical protein